MSRARGVAHGSSVSIQLPGRGGARIACARGLLACVFSGALVGGCTRAGVAALLPALELGVVARRHRGEGDAGDTARQAASRWYAAGYIGLSFRATPAAGQLPLRAELAPETWAIPCDEDDAICLAEAASAEAELAAALGELQ